MQSIDDFYRSKNILVTGSTGFLGKALLTTFVRKIPFDTLFLLIRPKHHRNAEERFHREVLSGSAFEGLRDQRGVEGLKDALQGRIRVIEGSVSAERMGLSPEPYQRLARKTDLIVHAAGLTDFTPPLDRALSSNVDGVDHVAEFAGESAAFLLHVSTCYVNHYGGPVLEQPLIPHPSTEGLVGRYDISEERDRLKTLLSDRQTDREKTKLGLREAERRNHHDTYTYTKALAEQVLGRHLEPEQRVIVRPAIIESALNDPAPGWIDGFKMCDPLFLAAAKGRLPKFPGNPEVPLDLVPVDTVVNVMICAPVYRARHDEPQVFQVASSTENPLKLKQAQQYTLEYFQDHPLDGQAPADVSDTDFVTLESFLRSLRLYKKTPLFTLRGLLFPLSVVPKLSYAYDLVRKWTKNVEDLEYYGEIYHPYSNTHTKYITHNLRTLWRATPPGDQKRFPFRIQKLDWEMYFKKTHFPGCERFIPLFRGSGADPEPIVLAGSDDGTSRPEDPEDTESMNRRYRSLLSPSSSQRDGVVETWHDRSLPEKMGYKLGNMVWRGIGRLFASVECVGREHVPSRGPFIIASNHSSHSDTLYLVSALRDRSHHIHIVAAQDYWFDQPLVVRSVLKGSMNLVPVKRATHRMKNALDVPLTLLRKGKGLIFYPEGTRGSSEKMRSFKVGLGVLSLGAGVPVIPTAIRGTYDVLPKHHYVPRPGSIRIQFGAPIPPEPYLNRMSCTGIKDEIRRVTTDAERRVRAMKSGLK